MIHCSQFDEIVSDYIEGHISPDYRAAIEQHISGCERCRILGKQISMVKSRLKQMTNLQTSEDFDNRLHARIANELREAQPALGRASRSWTLFNTKSAMALAAAACIALGALAWQQYSQTETFQAAPTAVTPDVPAAPQLRSNPQLTQSAAPQDYYESFESDSIEQDFARDREPRSSDYQDRIQVVRQTQ